MLLPWIISWPRKALPLVMLTSIFWSFLTMTSRSSPLSIIYFWCLVISCMSTVSFVNYSASILQPSSAALLCLFFLQFFPLGLPRLLIRYESSDSEDSSSSFLFLCACPNTFLLSEFLVGSFSFLPPFFSCSLTSLILFLPYSVILEPIQE